MTTAVVVLAAGAGERLGLAEPKAFVPLGGRPMLAHSIATVARWGGADRVVVVVAGGLEGRASAVAAEVAPRLPVVVVPGGETRQESVWLGLAAAEADVVLCHDAARPFATAALFGQVAAALAPGEVPGAVPGIRSPDTLKRVLAGRVVETIPRDEVVLVQTPQAFEAAALHDAHRRALAEDRSATDDAALLEAAGYIVAVIAGEAANFKVTTPADLRRAERALAEGAVPA